MLRIYEDIIQFVRVMAPVVRSVERQDRHLGDQMKRALQSIALNTAEGMQSRGGNRAAKYHVAAGSAQELSCCIDLAEAFGYGTNVTKRERDKLRQIIGTMLKLSGVGKG